MKTFVHYLLLLLFSFVFLISCESKQQKNNLTKWPVLSKESARLTHILETTFAENPDTSLFSAALDSLRQLANDNNPQLKSRSLYWEGRYLEHNGQTDSARIALEKALQYCDTLKYAYDYKRIRIILERLNATPPIERYASLIEDEKFFQECHDLTMQANVAQQLGNLCLFTLRFPEALHYLLRSDSLLAKASLETYRIKNRLNIAMAYNHCGEALKADSTLRPLLQNRVITSDPIVHNTVLNIFLRPLRN